MDDFETECKERASKMVTKCPNDEHLATVVNEIELEFADTEQQHIQADAILCEMIRRLGYPKTAEAFEQLTKWYA